MTDAKGWIEFEGRRSAADVAEPRITLQKGGSIGLNLAAYRLLGEPERVTFVTDGSKKRFGIRPADSNTPNSYPIRPQQSGRSFVLGARLFLKWAGIPPADHARTYVIRLEDGIGVVEIEPVKKQKAG